MEIYLATYYLFQENMQKTRGKSSNTSVDNNFLNYNNLPIALEILLHFKKASTDCFPIPTEANI